jgi:glycogen debranching enzyme
MPISFDRNVCCSLDETISREWLLTNGLGGYAAGTIVGTLTRMQQGLLVAALDEDTEPQLLVAKIDEEVLFDQRTYYLGTNEYQDGTLNPAGFVHLESFHLEEGFPIFTYRLGGIEGVMLEKRIWMLREENTTCIQYRVLRTSPPSHGSENIVASWRKGNQARYNGLVRPHNSPGSAPSSVTLTLLPFVAHRPYNQPQYGNHNWQFHVETFQHEPETDEEERTLNLPRGVSGCTIRAREGATPYHVLAVGHPESQPQFIPTGVWYWRFLRRHNRAASLPPTDDLYLPGVIRARLWPDKDATLTIIVTAEELASLRLSQKQLNKSYEQALDYQHGLLQTQRYFGEGGASVQTLPVLPLSNSANSSLNSDEFLQLLHQAGDRLLLRRTLPLQEHSGKPISFLRAGESIPSITSGYYALDDQMREALIALPGLTITTRRYSEAQRMLRYIARHFRQGLLSDRLPTAHKPTLEDADYGNADTTLWYFYALDKYLQATRDYELLDELYTRLADCITHYTLGTFHGICVDPVDGLLRIGPSERALTWMDGSAHGVLVTPRTGKPVEINALWYHALCLMHEWSHLLYLQGRINQIAQGYADQSEICRQSFNQRFWYSNGGFLYDLVDGPEGDDSRLRPNQLLAISLRHTVLDSSRQAEVLDVVTRQLLTPYGLRTLSPQDPSYQGRLPQDHQELQQALHQGGVWTWLIGPYIEALLRVGGQTSTTQAERDHRAPEPSKDHTWRKGLEILEPFCQHMQQDMLGSLSSVYDGDAPYNSGPQLASAISVGEILRIYKVLAHMGVQHLDQVISA